MLHVNEVPQNAIVELVDPFPAQRPSPVIKSVWQKFKVRRVDKHHLKRHILKKKQKKNLPSIASQFHYFKKKKYFEIEFYSLKIFIECCESLTIQ